MANSFGRIITSGRNDAVSSYGYITQLSGRIVFINPDIAVQNSVLCGSLSVARTNIAGVSGSTYGFFGGSGNVIDYIYLNKLIQNATDSGDLTVSRSSIAGVSGSTYGFFGGGDNLSNAVYDVIDYITLSNTTQNATDTGNLSVSRAEPSGVSGSTYGFFGGGGQPYTQTTYDTIDYITLANTTQNATDTGNLSVSRGGCAGLSGSTYGFFGGGTTYALSPTDYNTIDYITLANTTQNATDTGDLSVSKRWPAGLSGNIYGFFCGGYNSSTGATNVIEYIVLSTTTQNVTDTGDLLENSSRIAGVSS